MYYILAVNYHGFSRFSLYKVESDKYLCVGRSGPTSSGQCNFPNIPKMDNLYFHSDDRYYSPEGIAKLLNREHYRFDSYPDVANLHLTHPELFL